MKMYLSPELFCENLHKKASSLFGNIASSHHYDAVLEQYRQAKKDLPRTLSTQFFLSPSSAALENRTHDTRSKMLLYRSTF